MPSKSSPTGPMGGIGDPFALMQQLWGMSGMPSPANLASMTRIPQQMPSMLAPTVDLGELDKRIADLRAVEQWLELNASMLRTTIQTLEVQRATIATLKGIGGAMLAPMLGASTPPSPYPPLPPEFAFGRSEARAEAAPPPAATPAEPAVTPAPKGAKRSRKAAHATPSLADDALNPAAWWHTLQDQFSRIAATAADAAPVPAAKPRTRKRARRKA
jgi:hypothetical protein